MDDKNIRQDSGENKEKDPVRHVSDVRVEPVKPAEDMPVEVGGREGPEPTRYGDWEVHGKCTDF